MNRDQVRYRMENSACVRLERARARGDLRRRPAAAAGARSTRTGRGAHHPCSNASEQQVRDAAPAVRAHHDQVHGVAPGARRWPATGPVSSAVSCPRPAVTAAVSRSRSCVRRRRTKRRTRAPAAGMPKGRRELARLGKRGIRRRAEVGRDEDSANPHTAPVLQVVEHVACHDRKAEAPVFARSRSAAGGESAALGNFNARGPRHRQAVRADRPAQGRRCALRRRSTEKP